MNPSRQTVKSLVINSLFFLFTITLDCHADSITKSQLSAFDRDVNNFINDLEINENLVNQSSDAQTLLARYQLILGDIEEAPSGEVGELLEIIAELSPSTGLWDDATAVINQYRIKSLIEDVKTTESVINRTTNLHADLSILPPPSINPAPSELIITPSYHKSAHAVSGGFTFTQPNFQLEKIIRDNQSPAEIYQYVSSQISDSLRGPAYKSSQHVINTNSGNDIEQAILLKEMLELSGFKATLVTGLARYNLIELFEAHPDYNLNELIKSLQTAQRKFELSDSSETLFLEQTWVSAEIPYQNYRGVEIEDQSLQWTPISTWTLSLPNLWNKKANQQQDLVVVDFVNQYLQSSSLRSPFEQIKTDYLTPATHIETPSKLAAEVSYIPASLPFDTASISSESETASTFNQDVTIRLVSDNGFFDQDTIISTTLPLVDLVGSYNLLFFTGLSQDDSASILQNQGLTSTPLNEVKLTPKFTVNNKIKAFGTTEVEAGKTYRLEIQFSNEQNTTLTRAIRAGSYYAINFGNDISQDKSAAPRGGAFEDLVKLGYHYNQDSTKSDQEIASLFGFHSSSNAPRVSITAVEFQYLTFDGIPSYLDKPIITLDALYQPSSFTESSKSSISSYELIGLINLQNSWLERDVSQEYTEVNVISAESVLRQAAQQYNNIDYEISLDDVEASSLPEYLQDYLTQYLEKEAQIIGTLSPVQIEEWSGHAWLIQDKNGLSAASILNGELNGASNSSSDPNFKEPELPKSLEGTEHVAAVFITSPLPYGTAGQEVELTVRALSYYGAPVKAAQITLTADDRSGAHIPTPQGITDSKGEATFKVKLGTNTAIDLTYIFAEPPGPYPQRMGTTHIKAYAKESGVTYAQNISPFLLFFGPDEVASASLLRNNYRILGEFTDQYGNYIANVPVGIFAEYSYEGSIDIGRGNVNGKPFDTLYSQPKYGDMGYISHGDFCGGTYDFTISDPVRGDLPHQFTFTCFGVYGELDTNKPYTTEQDSVPAFGTVTANIDATIKELVGNITWREPSSQAEYKFYTRMHSYVINAYKYLDTTGSVESGIRLGEVTGEYEFLEDTIFSYLESDQTEGYTFLSQNGEDTFNPTNQPHLSHRQVATRVLSPSSVEISPSGMDNNYFQYYELSNAPEEYSIHSHAIQAAGGLLGTKVNTILFTQPWLIIPEGSFTLERDAQDLFTISEPVTFNYELPLDILISGNSSHLYNDAETSPLGINISYQELIDGLQQENSLIYEPIMEVYEDDVLISYISAETTSINGELYLPDYIDFDILNHDYFAQVVFHRGTNNEIRSELYPLIPNIILEYSGKRTGGVKSRAVFDVPNGQYCASKNDILVTLSQESELKITLAKYTGANNAYTLTGETLYEGTLGKGQHQLPIDTTQFLPGEYELSYQATSEETGKQETYITTLFVEYEKNNNLPIAHTIAHNVDLHDGSYNLNHRDLDLPLSNTSLNISRQYNSANTATSYFGPGWRDSNLQRVIETGCNYVHVAGKTFIEDGNGFKPSIGEHGTLLKSDDSYDYFTVGGVHYSFKLYPFTPNGEHLLEYIETPTGDFIRFAYGYDDLNGPYITVMQDQTGRDLEYEYSQIPGLGKTELRVTSVTFSGGAEIIYNYDEYARLISVQHDSDTIHQYGYAAAVLVDEDYRDSNSTYPELPDSSQADDFFIYDETILSGIHLDRAPLILDYKDAIGQKTSIEYSRRAHLILEPTLPELADYDFWSVTEVARPNGSAIKFNYNFPTNYGNTGINDAVASASISGTGVYPRSYALNQYGATLTESFQHGTTQTEWSERHLKPIKVTDRNDNVTYYEYDDNGNLVKESKPHATLSYSFTQSATRFTDEGVAKNLITSSTDGEGRKIEYQYDNPQCPYPTSVSYPKKTYKYNELCLLEKETDSEGNFTTYKYNAYGLVKEVTQPQVADEFSVSNSIIFSYDDFSRKTHRYDFQGETVYAYNKFGHLLSSSSPNKASVTYTVDNLGQILTKKDEIGRTFSFSYDASGNLTSETALRPDNASNREVTRTFNYSLRDVKDSETDWNGNIIDYTYDDDGRLVGTHYPLGKRVTLGLDNQGNITSETHTLNGGRTRTLNYLYDSQNRRTQVSDYEGVIETITYDRADNITQKTNAIGLIETYTYDDYNRLTRLVKKDSTGATLTKEDNDYNLNGWLTDTYVGDPLIKTEYSYDGLGHIIEETRSMISIGSSLTLSYVKDPDGRVLKYTDARRNTTINQYNKDGYLTRTIDAEGLNTDYVVDKLGRVETKTQPNGNRITYTYNSADLPVSVSDSISLLEDNQYDVNGNLTQRVDGNSHRYEYSYNALNQQTQVDNPDSGTYKYTYNHQNQVLTQTQPGQDTQTNSYSPRGYLLSQIDFNGHETKHEYDDMGNRTRTTDALDNITLFEYDALSRLIKTEYPDGTSELHQYDQLGRVTQYTDQYGILNEYRYGLYEQPSKEYRAGQRRLEREFYKGGLISFEKEGDGATVLYLYDDMDRITRETRGQNVITQYSYNTANRIRTTTTPDGIVTQQTLNERDLPLVITEGSATRTLEYDNNSNIVLDTSPEGGETSYLYDSMNRITSITDASQNTTAFEYDTLGRKSRHIDGNDNATDFTYDANGNLLTQTYADELVNTYTYDAANNPDTLTHNDGSVTQYGYDSLNRLITQTDTTGSISWTLDQLGNPTSIAHTLASGERFTESYQYDLDSRPVSHTSKAGITTHWEYTLNGRLKTRIYSNGSSQTYQYDNAGRMTRTQVGIGNLTLDYGNGLNLDTINYPNDVVTQYQYNDRNLISEISHSRNGANLISLEYGYDLNSNRVSERKNIGSETLETSYQYDDSDKLTQVTYPAAYGLPERTVNYTYDGANNRATETTSSADGADTKIYTYNALDQLTDISHTDPSADTVSYSYDDLGNVNTKTVSNADSTSTTQYLFDARNQLRQVTIGGSTVGQFLYDHNGQRIESTFTDDSQIPAASETKHSLYDGIQLLAEYQLNAEGTPTLDATYQFYQGSLLGRRALSEDNPTNNTQTYYHTDALSSVLATSKLDGTLAARYDYDAWGNELNNTGTSDNPLGYTGHQMDRDIGLIYANARYLDPDTGRFLSFDPFAGYDDKPISLHRYLYAYQNPMFYTDRNGMEAEPWFQGQINEHSDIVSTVGTVDTGNQALDYGLAFLASGENALRTAVNTASLVANAGTFAWAAASDRSFEQAEQDIMVSAMAAPGPSGVAAAFTYSMLTLKPFRAFGKADSALDVIENPLTTQTRMVPHTTIDDLPDVSDVMARADNIAGDVPKNKPVDGISLNAEFKDGMNVKEFNRKINRVENAINDGRATSNIPHNISDAERRSVTRKYRKDLQKRIESFYANDPEARDNALKRLRNSDIDHMLDLQLDGQNVRYNLKTLDSRVNQELGRQFSTQLPRGERVPIIDINVNDLPELP
jgi:RHS repeat-associated protein